jgi:glucose-1-phosphate thymidylyltransferase
MRGIVLAGGTGTRLWPATKAISKQLIPIHDKPMIYYPLTTLITAGVREVFIIVAPDQEYAFRQLLGDGSQWGMQFFYAAQPRPEGIAQALIIGEGFLDGEDCALILGDNLFHGTEIDQTLRAFRTVTKRVGAFVFGYEVSDPSRYGVIEFDAHGMPQDIMEKPEYTTSRHAVPGIYLLDRHAVDVAKNLVPSARGELEIAEVLQWYLEQRSLTVGTLGPGNAWLDTGTVQSLAQASEYVRILEERQGVKLGCVEESAWRSGFITTEELLALAPHSGYGSYLEDVAQTVRIGEHV